MSQTKSSIYGKSYELQNEYIDYFEKYKDNDDPRIKNEDISHIVML